STFIQVYLLSVVTQNYKLLGRNCPFLIFNITFFPDNSDKKFKFL
ncbi:hypothetical protein GA0116948_1338, partial [Chitinophaga costaii]